MKQEMRYVYQVYLDRSFSKAAAKLFISQPALSMAIHKLEEELGYTIFDRTSRPLELTEKGKIYLDFLKDTQYLEAELDTKLKELEATPSGKLTIGGSHYLNAYILPRLISDFTKEYPQIKLELVENSAYKLAGLLQERKIDLTFSCDETIVRQTEHYPAFTDQILLAVPKAWVTEAKLLKLALAAQDVVQGKHLEVHCPILALKQLQNYRYIILTGGNNLHWRCQELFHQAKINPEIILEVAQLVTAYHLAEAGMGATFTSDRLVHAQDSNLYYFKLSSELCTRKFFAILPPRKYVSLALKTFLEYLEKKL